MGGFPVSVRMVEGVIVFESSKSVNLITSAALRGASVNGGKSDGDAPLAATCTTPSSSFLKALLYSVPPTGCPGGGLLKNGCRIWTVVTLVTGLVVSL